MLNRIALEMFRMRAITRLAAVMAIWFVQNQPTDSLGLVFDNFIITEFADQPDFGDADKLGTSFVLTQANIQIGQFDGRFIAKASDGLAFQFREVRFQREIQDWNLQGFASTKPWSAVPRIGGSNVPGFCSASVWASALRVRSLPSIDVSVEFS